MCKNIWMYEYVKSLFYCIQVGQNGHIHDKIMHRIPIYRERWTEFILKKMRMKDLLMYHIGQPPNLFIKKSFL